MATRLLRIDGPNCVLELRLTEDSTLDIDPLNGS